MKLDEFSDRLAALPQYLLPKKLLTVLAGQGAALRAGWITRAVIRWFIARYRVNMAEAADPDPATYACFNHFFTRALSGSARPLAAAEFVSPVDGLVIQCGSLVGDQLLQAKGHSYSCLALLAGDSGLAARFNDGDAVTLYLSPGDYHRVHMPCDGRLLRMIHVPGDQFSVNPATVRGVPGLFARNERVVCVFESVHGLFVLTLVGATIVGSIATVWHGVVSPPHPRIMRQWHYQGQAVALRRGQEMGRFLIGSTVVMLFPRNTLRLQSDWTTARVVRMGEAMGSLRQGRRL